MNAKAKFCIRIKFLNLKTKFLPYNCWSAINPLALSSYVGVQYFLMIMEVNHCLNMNLLPHTGKLWQRKTQYKSMFGKIKFGKFVQL